MNALSTPKNFDHLVGALKGFSDKQLKQHFELYAGYVKKYNEITEKLEGADREKANYSYAEFSELQRRRAVAHNGAYLHELYFENLSAKGNRPSDTLKVELQRSFGSMEKWSKDALAGVKSAQGWVLLARSRLDGKLCNMVVEEHHRSVLFAHDILLAIDCWEHAFMIDYGIKRDEYFAALEPNLDWDIANKRFLEATKHL